ncbi:hypothetical protein MAR_012337 [Mya arenaria]|uniref:Uncharacterized protein n=1 Tax=Mya arenaria TaxID=6604 RepID=A0ABY7G0H0_MYAAR|nr:hypothetical protein MAR_012337 [Mya arenaria]
MYTTAVFCLFVLAAAFECNAEIVIRNKDGLTKIVHHKVKDNFFVAEKNKIYKFDSEFNILKEQELEDLRPNANYTSKISRMCNKNYRSFFDTPIQCEDYESYNVVQDALLVDVDRIKRLYITFAHAEQTGNSILCSAEMEDINQKLKLLQERAGIDGFADLECVFNQPYFKSGKGTVKTNLLSKTNNKEGYITTLSTTKVENKDVLIAGTSNGFILKIDEESTYASTTTTVKFIVKNLPQRLENDTYFCQVEDSQVLETVIQGDELSCTIVGKNEHKEVSMRLSKDCPRLEKIHQRYIPSGVDTNLTLQIRNLNNIVQDEDKSSDADDISIHVEFQSNRFKCSDITTGSIHCTINGTTNIKKENLLLQIYYETESGKVYIDNPYSIDVIVYNCYKLSQGKCNYCNALNFQCKLGPYRSNNTTRNETRFYLMETISEINGSNVLPIWKKTGDVYVLSIEPNKGPAIGGTIISLTGKNLGIGNRAVKSVLFDESETLCVNSKVQSFLDPILGNVDFRVTCKVNINDKRMPGTRMKFSELTIPDKEHIKTGEEVSELFFNFLPNPEIGSIQPNKVIAFFVCFLTVVAFFVCKYRKVGSKAKALEKQLNNLELEIKHVAKEEFLDMQTSMSTVNRNLIEQGFPYHSYQQYACNAMFATDYLMSDPVMSDELRARARTGMERFQGLLENKSNFAGNLCAIMMGRMDYMHEVLQVLITQLVEDPSSKRDVKTLFRSYSIRIWAMLIKTPSILFDINAPSYVSESLDVISQVFIESFSRTEQAVSKILDDLSICQETRCLQLNKKLDDIFSMMEE